MKTSSAKKSKLIWKTFQEIMTAEVQSNTCLYLYFDVRLRTLKKINYPMTPNPYST